MVGLVSGAGKAEVGSSSFLKAADQNETLAKVRIMQTAYLHKMQTGFYPY